jgi:hypothetical protein
MNERDAAREFADAGFEEIIAALVQVEEIRFLLLEGSRKAKVN